MRDNMQSTLQAYYAWAFPATLGLQVIHLLSITAGWESEMYAFDVEYGPAENRRREALVLRLYPGDHGHAKVAHEFHSMRQLHQADYSVPSDGLCARHACALCREAMLPRAEANTTIFSTSLGSEAGQAVIAFFYGLAKIAVSIRLGTSIGRANAQVPGMSCCSSATGIIAI